MLDIDLAMTVLKPTRLAILFNEQITNTDDERLLSVSAIPKTVKIMLFPKPVGRTARTSSPFFGLLTGCFPQVSKQPFNFSTFVRLLLRHLLL